MKYGKSAEDSCIISDFCVVLFFNGLLNGSFQALVQDICTIEAEKRGSYHGTISVIYTGSRITPVPKTNVLLHSNQLHICINLKGSGGGDMGRVEERRHGGFGGGERKGRMM